MTKTEQVKPKDCPTPSYHKTHMYCPFCSWVEDVQLTDDEKN